ncbi:transglutaminase domain-containing protein [Pararhodobacter sp. SW119]|uniref:transglutaminase-like domain-containing protein n=1 Tax=Pararhodobacter sp. SW119 TaxID=2780075 RepID=UPI001ADFBD9F|nr:transglutaminase domain-containing protein [Pararhodobacter sp. SW119]
MSGADRFACTVTLRFDPWGYAADGSLDVLLPLPSDDGYQRVLGLDAPRGRDITDEHGRRRMIRLDRGQVATVSARIETRRLVPGAYLDVASPGPADLAPAPMIVPDDALRDLAGRSIAGVGDTGVRITALAHAAAGALRYRYPRDARGAALSLARGWGDCGEYAFVFVALCHVAGIPARPVFGLITAPWMTTPHAWAEAWDGNGWLPVDPNLVREGDYLGPILDTGRDTRDHISALDPYRLVLSRHTGLPWPGEPVDPVAEVPSIKFTAEGLGEVVAWHETPRWQGVPVVPFLQLPWTAIRQPSHASPRRWLQRIRAWRFGVHSASRWLPRNPLVWTDVVAMHPLKGAAAVFLVSFVTPFVPSLSGFLQAGVSLWAGLFGIGMLRSLRLIRVRSPLWLRIEASFRRNIDKFQT